MKNIKIKITSILDYEEIYFYLERYFDFSMLKQNIPEAIDFILVNNGNYFCESQWIIYSNTNRWVYFTDKEFIKYFERYLNTSI